MAFFSKKEFAAKCGLETKHLSTYVDRGQIKYVKKDGQDMVDGADPINKAFAEARKGKQTEKQLVAELQKRNPVSTKPAKGHHTDAFDKIMAGDDEMDLDEEDTEGGILSLDKASKKLKHFQALKTERESRLLLLKEQKLKGIVIPSELVKPLFLQHNISLTTEFRNGAEDLMRVIAQKEGWTNDQKSEFKGLLVKIINTAVGNADAATIKSLGTIIDEYSIKKSVGERG